MKLQFLGANRQVTGSRYRVEAAGSGVLLDCGMFQERDELHRNWEPSPAPPESVEALLLTHAHLDHSGLIPRFVAEGFGGPIMTTPATIDLARIVLEDAAHIQEEDAAYKKRRHRAEGRSGPHPEVPLYTVAEAEAACRQFKRVNGDEPVEVNHSVTARYYDAGHILGSSMIEVVAAEGGSRCRVVFSGDVGQWDRPLAHNPATFQQADYVVMESTYGDRNHEAAEPVLDGLARVVNDTIERGGNVVIPTFAIDRAQALLFYLGTLVRAGRIPRVTIFLDSPMAIDVTDVYKGYKHLLDEETQALFDRGEHPFQFPGMHFVRSGEESRSINSIRGSAVILAGAGMCNGGRIKHHLRHNISRPESTILFVGFQARQTLGRRIVDGDPEVRIHGRPYPVKAKIEQLSGLSAHSDRDGLMRWLAAFKSPPKTLFLTHGELEASESLAEHVRTELGWNVCVPEYGQVVELGD